MISTPTFDMREPIGPIAYGTTYLVRPFIEPRRVRVDHHHLPIAHLAHAARTVDDAPVEAREANL